MIVTKNRTRARVGRAKNSECRATIMLKLPHIKRIDSFSSEWLSIGPHRKRFHYLLSIHGWVPERSTTAGRRLMRDCPFRRQIDGALSSLMKKLCRSIKHATLEQHTPCTHTQDTQRRRMEDCFSQTDKRDIVSPLTLPPTDCNFISARCHTHTRTSTHDKREDSRERGIR